MKGTVIWFNNGKGFGFLKRADGEKDLFVHHSEINMEGYRSLKEGDKVQFEVGDGPNGIQACDVEVLK